MTTHAVFWKRAEDCLITPGPLFMKSPESWNDDVTDTLRDRIALPPDILYLGVPHIDVGVSVWDVVFAVSDSPRRRPLSMIS